MELNLEQKKEILQQLTGNTFAYGFVLDLKHYDAHWTTYCGKPITVILTSGNRLVAIKNGHVKKSAAYEIAFTAKVLDIVPL